MLADPFDYTKGKAFVFPSVAFDRPYPRTYIDAGLPKFDVPDKPPQHSIRSINWNPFGNLVATGSVDKTLRVCKSILPTLAQMSFQLANVTPREPRAPQHPLLYRAQGS